MTVSESDISFENSRMHSHSEKTSRSLTSSSRESFQQQCNPALDEVIETSASSPMNLVPRTRMAKARQNERDFLEQTATKSTMRTSFSTHNTDSSFARIHEEVTVTDDGPVQEDIKEEEEVYKKLSELKIVPTDDVPKIVAAPSPTDSRRSNNKSTSSASSSSSRSFNTASGNTSEAMAYPEQSNVDFEDSSSESSVISDISGLTGSFARETDTEPVVVPRQVISDSSSRLPYQEEELKAQSLLKVAAAKAKGRRQVSFSTVCIREYERILGDNPSCSCGPSIGIGWNYDEEEEILSINEWESWRETEREPDRLVLCREEREDLLLSLGYPPKVIAQAVRDIIKMKNKRRQTITNLGASGVEEMMESATRKIKKLRRGKGAVLSLGKKKRKNESDDDEESLYA